MACCAVVMESIASLFEETDNGARFSARSRSDNLCRAMEDSDRRNAGVLSLSLHNPVRCLQTKTDIICYIGHIIFPSTRPAAVRRETTVMRCRLPALRPRNHGGYSLCAFSL